MPIFTMRAEVARFDGTKWSQDLDDRMYKLFIEAGRLFMLEINRRIPIRTGFLRGAFTTLEDLVGVTRESGLSRKGTRLPVKAESIRNKFDLNRNAIAAQMKRLETLRTKQTARFRKILELRSIEGRRTAHLASIIESYQAARREAGSHGLGIRKAIEKRDFAIAEVRREALRDRRMRTKLVALATRDAREVHKEIRSLDKALGAPKGKALIDRTLYDVIGRYNARVEKIELVRERRFFRTLKNLEHQVNGYRDRRTGKVVAAKIDQDEYDRRLKDARSRLTGRHSKIEQIQGKIRAARQKRSDVVRDVLFEKLKARAARRKEKFKVAEARIRVERYIKRAERSGGILTGRINRRGDRLIQAVSAASTPEGRKLLERLQAQMQKKHDYSTTQLNTLVRVRDPKTGKYRITRLNRDGSAPKNAVSYLNEKVTKNIGTDRETTFIRNQFLEYYRPNLGGKVLKTPRSGRQFATPTRLIIRKEQFLQGADETNAFQFLLGQLQAAGIKPRADIQRAAKFGVKANNAYTFNYDVDIWYLHYNDIKLAWQAWNSAINIFRLHIETQALKKVPPLEQYIVSGTLYQSPTTISRPF